MAGPGRDGDAVTSRAAPRSLAASLLARLRGLRVALRAVVGAPDYERYLAHHAARHAGTEPLTPAEFERRWHERRARPGGRCC